jgi:hypothetical protein
VTTDPLIKTQLTLHPDWTSGNILLYSVNGRLIYVIPYYGTQGNLTVPEMVAVVDGSSKQVGRYFIQDPTSSIEVGSATTKAVNTIGISTTQITVSGNLTSRDQYVHGGNTRWILGISTTGGLVYVLAKEETLTEADKLTLTTTPFGKPITLVVDNTTSPYTVLSVK